MTRLAYLRYSIASDPVPFMPFPPIDLVWSGCQVLKLSKEKFDDARDHAMRAVVADNRMRIWYVDKSNMEVGLLFTCRLGNVDLERPVGAPNCRMLHSHFCHILA